MILTLASLGPIYSLSKLTLNPKGMPAALQETEYFILNHKAADALPGQPTFDAILTKYADERNQLDSARGYYAVKMLLSAVAKAESDDKLPNQQTMDRAATAVDNDQRNFITRMLYAALIDAGQRRAEASPTDRLTAMDQVLSAQPTTTTGTTYDVEYRDLLADTFAATASRPDVAASMGAKWYETYIVDQKDWLTVLPTIAQSLNGLRRDLIAAGDAEGAEKCRRWLAGLCLGLVSNSGDETIQCLAAETLAASESDNPAVSKPMRALVDAHTSDNLGHAADWAAQFKNNGAQPQPSLAQAQYERAFEYLLLYMLFVILAVSAAIAFVIGITSIVAPTDAAEVNTETNRPVWKSPLVFIAIAVLTPSVLAWMNANLFHDGRAFYSEALAFGVVHAMFFGGLGFVILHAIIAAWPGRDRVFRMRRGWPALVIAVACGAFLALPAQSASRLLRSVNYDFPQLWWSAAAMLLFVVFAVLVARVPARQLARSAASTWFVFAILACITITLHVNADHDYQRAIVEAHRDPMAARVGKDWKKTYVEPVRKAFTPPIP